ncbi:putative mannosyltransferase [Microbacterium sp. TS-1]|nr:putative mannosyltransferase [Microbacterium sp. TS-1]
MSGTRPAGVTTLRATRIETVPSAANEIPRAPANAAIVVFAAVAAAGDAPAAPARLEPIIEASL